MKSIKERIQQRLAITNEHLGFLDAVTGESVSLQRTTRCGKAALAFGILLEAIEPVLSLVIVMVLACVPAFAQTGGTVFGQDQSMVPNAVRQTIIFLAGIAFLVGAGTIIWGAFQYSRRQECMHCFIGGGFLMVIGGVIALISYLASGRAVTVDRTLN